MFSLVGNRQGRKAIRWGCVVFTFLGTTLLSAFFAAGIYAVVAGNWHPPVLLVGPGVGIVATIVSVLASYATRIQRLPMLYDGPVPGGAPRKGARARGG